MVKNKDKKKGRSTKGGNPRTNEGTKEDVVKQSDPEILPAENQLDQSIRTIDNNSKQQSFRTVDSEELECHLCDIHTGELEWFVQCDECDQHFHFNCVGLRSIKPEDPWSCFQCKIRHMELPDANSTATARESIQSNKDSDNNSRQRELDTTTDSTLNRIQDGSKIVVSATVHQSSGAILEDIDEQEDEHDRNSQLPFRNKNRSSKTHNVINPRSRLSQIQEFIEIDETSKETSHRDIASNVNNVDNRNLDRILQHSNNQRSQKSSSSHQGGLTISTKTRSNSSSQQRREIDLKRAQEELDLQTKIDTQRLAVEFEAKMLAAEIKMAENKMKQEEITLREFREKRFLEENYKAWSLCSSATSRSSVITERLSRVASWVDEQNYRLTETPTNEDLQRNRLLNKNIQNPRRDKDVFNLEISIPVDIDEREAIIRNQYMDTISRKEQPTKNANYQDLGSFREDRKVFKIQKSLIVPNKQQLDIPKTNNVTFGPVSRSTSVNARPTQSQLNPTITLERQFGGHREGRKKLGENTQDIPQIKTSQSHSENWSKSYERKIHKRDDVNTQNSQYFEGQSSKFGNERARSFNRQEPPRNDQSQGHDHRSPPSNRIQSKEQSPSIDNNSSESDVEIYENDYLTHPNNRNLWMKNRVLTKEHIAARQITDRRLPFFNGEPDEWRIWYRTLCTTTVTCGFNNAENISRIEKSLQDKARKQVKNRLTDPESVPWIVETLEMCYGQPEVVIQYLVSEIKAYPTLKENNLESLRDFALQVQGVTDAMESMELQERLDDPRLVDKLVNKLPTQTKMNWAMHIAGKPKPNLKTLAIWLYEIAKVLSKIIRPSMNGRDDKKSNNGNENKSTRMNVHVESNEGSQPQSEGKKKMFPCRACNERCDKLENCPKFKSLSTSDRYKVINEHKLCRRCLRYHKNSCYSMSICETNGCQFKHHPLLHSDSKKKEQKQHTTDDSNVSETYTNENATPEINNVHYDANEGTMLRIAPVMLHNKEKSVLTFAFHDDGSTATMMEKHIADKLGLSGTPEELCLLWTKNIHRKERAERVSLEISGTRKNDRHHQLKGIRTVSSLHLPTQSINKTELIRKYPYLANVPFDGYENAVPGILIGSDYPRLSTQLKIIEGEVVEGPVASKTRLGWSIHGPRNVENEVKWNYHNFEICEHHNQIDSEIHQRVKEYFSIENFGVQAIEKMNVESRDNQRALDLLKKFTKKIEGRYETGLLWKQEDISLPDSYPMAMKRLISLEKQGDKVVKIIGDKITEYVAKNYARKLTKEELKTDRPCWYLPPFGVIHPKKPEKLRMVFDAAAKVKKVCLNSVLLKGTDEFTSLVDILRRFRERSVAVSADIKEMYHQIRIREKDQ